MATKLARQGRPRLERPTLEFERKAFYSPIEVARILGVSTQTVLDRIHDGSLYGVRLSPRIYRVPLGGLLMFLGEPPRIKRITRSVRRLPRWARELDGEGEPS